MEYTLPVISGETGKNVLAPIKEEKRGNVSGRGQGESARRLTEKKPCS